ncbi:hypothetical protein NDU88_002714 [Pleurodeles waltl]|uniref:Uncharacterized protein n=1 Tax=Pleurodeles waltl TaxID=8319 RepID=A0AAV7W3Z7_PLEWA|nr:hypothetical protein NDU88_002714 [Pleurodeles waltl]
MRYSTVLQTNSIIRRRRIGIGARRAATHKAPVGHATDTEVTSDTEGEGSTTTGTRGDTSDTDTSSEGSPLAVVATSGLPASTGTAATQCTSSALPAAPQPSLRARSPKKAGISFAPGTSGPAPVTPAALSAEVIDLLQTIIVGQSTLLNAIQGVEREVHRSNAYLEGIHSGQAAHQRSFNALASALTAAIVPIHRPASREQPAPPGKRTRKIRGRREKTDTAAPKEQSPGPSPATTSRGAKDQRASSKEGKGSRAEKSASRGADQEGPTSPIPGVREDTHGPRTLSQKGPATARSEGD